MYKELALQIRALQDSGRPITLDDVLHALENNPTAEGLTIALARKRRILHVECSACKGGVNDEDH